MNGQDLAAFRAAEGLEYELTTAVPGRERFRVRVPRHSPGVPARRRPALSPSGPASVLAYLTGFAVVFALWLAAMYAASRFFLPP